MRAFLDVRHIMTAIGLVCATGVVSGCNFAGVNAHKPEEVLTKPEFWKETYPGDVAAARRLVEAAAQNAEWVPVSLSAPAPENVQVFQTTPGFNGVGIWGRIVYMPVDAGHTSIEVTAMRRNDLHMTTDHPISAVRRFHAELLRVASREAAR